MGNLLRIPASYSQVITQKMIWPPGNGGQVSKLQNYEIDQLNAYSLLRYLFGYGDFSARQEGFSGYTIQ
ncbi:MAG: hypothetical protein R8G66_27455 [Cytophagales bacterium]|nr:hypothetical protein [Cytophagales bacterium]